MFRRGEKNISGSYLLQIAHHCLLVTPEDAAEELHNLLVVQVVDALDDAWQEQLHCQVQIPMELIWRPGKVQFSYFVRRNLDSPPATKPKAYLRLSLS